MKLGINLVRVAVVFLLVVNFGSVVAGSQATEEKAVLVSLIRVIANPEKYDGHRLRVIGVLGYGGGLDYAVCLYISETDARNGVMPNCISLDQSVGKDDRRLGKYVILNGTFHYVSGHGLEYLSLKDISDIKLWSSPPGK